MLTVAGDQAPVIPLVEVVGKLGAGSPLQIAGIALKVGVAVPVTVIAIVVEAVAHCPAVGVKV